MQVEDRYRFCVEALSECAQAAGFTDALVGLSGGIDSSMVAVMCVDAFGADHVHGVLLPGPYSSDHSCDDALELARNLGIETETISICEPFEAFREVLASACGGALAGVAAENAQARCRMVCLMALSNTHGWMLVNTGNKSEACMGYSTLYGDTAGVFAPLGGLYKTDVYVMGRYRNERAKSEGLVAPIPERVFVKPPSAELAPDQEDEKSMGVNYALLDKILMAYVEAGLSAKEIATLIGIGGEMSLNADDLAATIDRVIATTDAYAFKRALEPPFPQVKFYD